MYAMLISGDREAKAFLAGQIVTNSGNLTREFSFSEKSVVFNFRYRSDARIVLRRIAKAVKSPLLKDTLTHNGAELKIVKN